MGTTRSLRGVLGALAVAVFAASLSAEAESLTLRIAKPAAGEPAVDLVELEVVVEGAGASGIETVEVLIDGEFVHRWSEPPYRTSLDFGVTGNSHTIVVRAVTGAGTVAEARLETPAVRIDELVDLELQQIYVTVTDKQGRRVPGLAKGDFSVKESKRAQQIVTFGFGEIPFTAILLVDSSLSMRGKRLEAALTASRRFARGMRPLDQAQLLAFSDHLHRVTPVGGGADLVAALEAPIEAAGGTAVRDHLYLATRLLEPRQGRRAILLLTDGWDHVSVLDEGRLAKAIERSQSVLYWVRLAGDEPTSFHMRDGTATTFAGFHAIRYNPPPSSWQVESRARDNYRELQRLVRFSGGRVAVADNVGEMEAVVADILDELHEQYALGYYPDRKERLPFYPVEVKLSRSGLKASTRSGYVDR